MPRTRRSAIGKHVSTTKAAAISSGRVVSALLISLSKHILKSALIGRWSTSRAQTKVSKASCSLAGSAAKKSARCFSEKQSFLPRGRATRYDQADDDQNFVHSTPLYFRMRRPFKAKL